MTWSGCARRGVRRCSDRGMSSSSPGRGAWGRPVSRRNWPARSWRGGVRELHRGTAAAAAALADLGAATTPVLLVLDDLDAAAGAPRRRATRRARCHARLHSCSHLANGIPGAPHRELRPLDADAVAELAATIAGEAASRFRSTPCSTRPRACRSRFKRSLRSGFAPRPAAASGSCSPRAAGRQELRAAQADLTSSVVDLQQALDRVDADVEAAERVCPFKGLASFDVADADTFFGREQLVAEPRRAPAGSDAARRRRAVGKRQVVDRASRALRRPREWRARLGGLGAGRHSTGRASARRAGSGAAQPNGREALARDRSARGGLHALPRRGRAHAVPRRAHASRPHETVVIAVRADFYGRFATLSTLAASSPRTTCWSAR